MAGDDPAADGEEIAGSFGEAVADGEGVGIAGFGSGGADGGREVIRAAVGVRDGGNVAAGFRGDGGPAGGQFPAELGRQQTGKNGMFDGMGAEIETESGEAADFLPGKEIVGFTIDQGGVESGRGAELVEVLKPFGVGNRFAVGAAFG